MDWRAGNCVNCACGFGLKYWFKFTSMFQKDAQLVE